MSETKLATKADLKEMYDRMLPYLGGASSLSDLDNVELTSPEDDQVLTYNSASGKWKNETPSGGSPWIEVKGTLPLGETTITLSNPAITSTSTIDVYTDEDVSYNSVIPGTGSVTITFDAQVSNLAVKVRVS